MRVDTAEVAIGGVGGPAGTETDVRDGTVGELETEFINKVGSDAIDRLGRELLGGRSAWTLAGKTWTADLDFGFDTTEDAVFLARSVAR